MLYSLLVTAFAAWLSLLLLPVSSSTFIMSRLALSFHQCNRVSFKRGMVRPRPWFSSQRQFVQELRAFIVDEDHNSSGTGVIHLMDQVNQPVDMEAVQSDLTRTEIRRMRVADLRRELSHRGMSEDGTREVLQQRLLQVVPPVTFKETKQSSSTAANAIELPDCPLVQRDQEYDLFVKGVSSRSLDGTGVGIVLCNKGDDGSDGPDEIWTGRKFLEGNRRDFEAEYTAIVLGLRLAKSLGVCKVQLNLDQDVILKQLLGEYEIMQDRLKPLYWNAMNLKESLETFSLRLVTRLENVIAKDLADKALATGKSINIHDSYDPLEKSGVVGKLQVKPHPRPVAAPKIIDFEGHRIDPAKTYRLEFDGGARGNPAGVAGAGIVIYDEDNNEIWCGWKHLGSMSNNAAEYISLLYGLRCAKSLGIRKLVAQGDSELIIKQLIGIYRVKNQRLKKLWDLAKFEANDFENVKFKHVRREQNQRADWLANIAMDNLDSYGVDEISTETFY